MTPFFLFGGLYQIGINCLVATIADIFRADKLLYQIGINCLVATVLVRKFLRFYYIRLELIV